MARPKALQRSTTEMNFRKLGTWNCGERERDDAQYGGLLAQGTANRTPIARSCDVNSAVAPPQPSRMLLLLRHTTREHEQNCTSQSRTHRRSGQAAPRAGICPGLAAASRGAKQRQWHYGCSPRPGRRARPYAVNPVHPSDWDASNLGQLACDKRGHSEGQSGARTVGKREWSRNQG